MKKSKWLIYTVLIGLTPLICRAFICLFRNDLEIDYIFNVVDMVTFGLVLHVSNINELEGQVHTQENNKSTYIGLSTFLIVIFSVFLGIAYLAELETTNNYNLPRIKICTGILSIFSLFFSYTIYQRQSNGNGS